MQLEFARGDAAHHAFLMPADAWTPLGRLFFAAKRLIDDDNNDASAVIQGDWGDGAVTTVVEDGITYKKYACDFPASATNSVLSNGATELDLLGEFQFVPAGGDPITFPAAGDKIPTVLYFDVKRKTTV